MDTNVPYSSAFISFLDESRDPKRARRLLAYPIFKIELQDITETGMVTSRIFEVVDGKWVEMPCQNQIVT